MPLPVQLTLETGWFGDATMYLTQAGPGQLPLAQLPVPQAPMPSRN
jgi:hypothetical protein